MTPADNANNNMPQQMKPTSVIDASAVRVCEAATPDEFAQCLEQVRNLAGPLSHREIAAKSEHRLARTKIGQVLNGTLPKREFLGVFLDVCGVPEADQEPWFETWSRLTAVGQPVTAPARHNVRVAAETIIKHAEAKAHDITAKARAEADAIMNRAMAEVEEARAADNVRVEGAELERDAALARARSLTVELDVMHNTSRRRLRDADEERDTAFSRAHDLAIELGQMHESNLKRIRSAEEERDAALARIGQLGSDLDAAQDRIDELREQLGLARDAHDQARRELAESAQTVRVRHEAADEHYTPDYLIQDQEIFENREETAPPVIGE